MFAMLLAGDSKEFSRTQFWLAACLLVSAIANGAQPTFILIQNKINQSSSSFYKLYKWPICILIIIVGGVYILDTHTAVGAMKFDLINSSSPSVVYILWFAYAAICLISTTETNRNIAFSRYTELIYIYSFRTIISTGIVFYLLKTNKSVMSILFCISFIDLLASSVLIYLTKKNNLKNLKPEVFNEDEKFNETNNFLFGWATNLLIIVGTWLMSRSIYTYDTEGVFYSVYVYLIRMLNVSMFGYSAMLQHKTAGINRLQNKSISFDEVFERGLPKTVFSVVTVFTLIFLNYSYISEISSLDLFLINLVFILFSLSTAYNAFSSYWLLKVHGFRKWIISDLIIGLLLLVAFIVLTVTRTKSLILAIFLFSFSYLISCLYARIKLVSYVK